LANSIPSTVGWEERLDPGRANPLWGEHRARYRFALVHASGARVLDVACGSGYGSSMLRAAGAASVIGLDFSEEAIALARRLRKRPDRVHFGRGDIGALPLGDGLFDLVTCFETIEHVPRPEQAVREIARVMKPTGRLFISSPNGAFFPGGHSGNPFHHKEFKVNELARLLAPHFPSCRIFGQRLTRTSPGVLSYSGEPVQGRVKPESDHRLRRELFGRLPWVFQDLIWRLVRGEPYYPTEHEFVLEAEQPERFPVIVAVCQRE
jgi:SAM-dependent methyltransferase